MALVLIINQSFNSGIFPDKLKIAKIIPIYKKGEKNVFNNYRPISLLPAISKIFESIMYKQIYSYLEEFKILYDKQFGFRKGRSTELATLELVDGLITEMDKGDIPICFFLDLSKAFDTLDHSILIEKLKYYGIKNKSLDLLTHYLTNRQQYVDFNDTMSNFLTITTGVPQGSILGPLLFLIYVNDIANASILFKFILFADDTTLKTTVNIAKKDQRKAKGINNTINYELDKINIWLKSNKLSLSTEKTKFMVFHQTNKVIPKLNFKISSISIEKVNEFSFLGLNLDSKLNWSAHLRKLSGKLNRAIGIMNKLKYLVPKEIKILLYNSFILSQINYCTLTWGFKIETLNSYQKSAVRIITNSDYLAHSEPLLKELNILKFKDIFTQRLIKFYFKYLNNDLPKYFLDIEFKQNIEIHRHDTRSKEEIHLNKTGHVFADNCLRNHIPKFLNNLNEMVRSKFVTHSLAGILNYFKQLTIKNYDFICTDRYCYSCHPPSDSDTDSDTDSDSNSDSDTASDSDTDSDIDTETDTDSDTDSNSDTDSDSDTDSN